VFHIAAVARVQRGRLEGRTSGLCLKFTYKHASCRWPLTNKDQLLRCEFMLCAGWCVAYLYPGTVLQYFVKPLERKSCMCVSKTETMSIENLLLFQCSPMKLGYRPCTKSHKCPTNALPELTEKHNMTTCVSAYESDRSRSNSSCPSHVLAVINMETRTQSNKLTRSIPQTEFHQLVVNIKIMNVILEYGGLTEMVW
jgi:hypothetical protein